MNDLQRKKIAQGFCKINLKCNFAAPKIESNYLIYFEMTKADIVNEIAEKTGIEKVAVQATVEAMMKSIKTSVSNGDNVYLRGFGSFIVKKRAQKTGRNISKNTTIIIPEHNIPAFKPAKVFVEKVKVTSKKK